MFESNAVAELMMIKFGESGHPVFRATSPVSPGTLKSKGNLSRSYSTLANSTLATSTLAKISCFSCSLDFGQFEFGQFDFGQFDFGQN